MSVMQDLVSASAATILLERAGTAVVFIAVSWYWQWLPHPHSF
jgi:hypothetical protein